MDKRCKGQVCLLQETKTLLRKICHLLFFLAAPIRGHHSQSTASIWVSELHPLHSRRLTLCPRLTTSINLQFAFSSVGLLPCSSNLSILLVLMHIYYSQPWQATLPHLPLRHFRVLPFDKTSQKHFFCPFLFPPFFLLLYFTCWSGW